MLMFISWLVQEVFNLAYFQLFGDRLPSPAKMEAVGTVTKLCLYPLKSGRRVETELLHCETMGPRMEDTYDRSLMVIDEEGGFLTARRYPEMVLISCELGPGRVQLTAPGSSPLTVLFADVVSSGCKVQVRVWNDSVPALDCGDTAAAWLTTAIPSRGGGCRLVYFPHQVSARSPHIPPFPLRAADGSAFADLTGYMLMNQASVEELSERVGRAVNVDGFRGNIVISGAPAFAEDNWRYLAIGDVVFENVKPCTRCLFTTVDPEKGVRDPEGQPLKALKQFRLCDDPERKAALGSSPLFGINLGLRRGGVIRRGDTVYASVV